MVYRRNKVVIERIERRLQMRKLHKTLYGQQGSNNETPVRFIGIAQVLEEEEIVTQEEVDKVIRNLEK